MNWQRSVVNAQLTVHGIAGSILRLPISALLIVGLLEIGATFAGRLTVLTVVVLVVLVVLRAFINAYWAVVMLGQANEPPARVTQIAISRLKDVLGSSLLQGLGVGLAAVPVFLTGALLLYHPVFVPGSPVAPFPATSLVLLVGAISLVGAPLFGRWLCALPLIVQRGLGTRAAMRSSWHAVRGSTRSCALLWLVCEVPVLVTVAAPASVRLPLTFVDAFVAGLLQTALSVAVYRQLFANVVRGYPITDEGRLEFEADGALLVPQGYRVASSNDSQDSREITWSR